MRKISVSDGENIVFLRLDLEFSIEPEIVGETATMASGRVIRDHVGIKNKLTVPTGWLSPEDLQLLIWMIGRGQALTIRYPDVDGDHEDEYWVSPPVRKAFSYGKDGVSQWYGVELKAEQYGVTVLDSAPPETEPIVSAEIVDGAFVIRSRALRAAIADGAFAFVE